MAKPHVHAELIKAWADGAEIQFFNTAYNRWYDYDNQSPGWFADTKYRIKPTPKPDIIKEEYINHYALDVVHIRITWDGETGKPKKVEII